MRKYLKLLGSISLVTTGVATTAIVVSCSPDFNLPSQPRNIIEATILSNAHINNSQRILAKLGDKVPAADDTERLYEWQKDNFDYQDYIIEFTWGSAYAVKGIWFRIGERPVDDIAQFEILIKELQDNSASPRTKEYLKAIIDWTKVDPLN